MSHRAGISFFMASSQLIARHARETSGRLAPAAQLRNSNRAVLIASPGASATCRISFAPCRRAALSLKANEQPIDTSTAAGKCFLDILGVFAEFETNLRRERQLEGIAKAKAEGVYKGRPASI